MMTIKEFLTKYPLATLPPMQPSQEEIMNAEKISPTIINHDYKGRTPQLWNTVYQKLGLGDRFVSFMVIAPGDTEGVVRDLKKLKNYIGGGLGVGHKDTASKLTKLIDIDVQTAPMGSINLLAKDGDKLRGYNTDAEGFVKSLLDLGSVQMKKILTLGAGGTAKAIAIELCFDGAGQILILNRTSEKAQQIVNTIKTFNKSFPTEALGESQYDLLKGRCFDIIINCTTKGADGEFSKFSALADTKNLAKNLKLSKERLQDFFTTNPNLIVADVNLTSRMHEGKTTTVFLDQARELGIITLNGEPMVLNQGIEAFWLANKNHLDKSVTKEQVAEIMKSVM